jgi:hypothetical protein
MSSTITVVSGLPRSGTSMMMKMLEAGGIPPLADGVREADDDNPKGYYEFERVKKLPDDTGWLPDAEGKAVKIITQLLLKLPETHSYRVVFMRRKIDEILASQKKMLIRRGTFKEDGPSEDRMRAIMLKHVDQVLGWMKSQGNVEFLEVNYNEMLADPAPRVPQVNQFLGGTLDEGAMLSIVDPDLYRQRK